MRRRMVEGIELKPTEPHGYEFAVGRFDYHLRREADVGWVLDQFRSGIDNADLAHVASIQVESIRDGVLYGVEETS